MFIAEHRDRFGGPEPICTALTGHGISITPACTTRTRPALPGQDGARGRTESPGPEGVQGQLQRLRARKIWHQLRKLGHQVARCTVERLMREVGITGAVRGKKTVTTLQDRAAEQAPVLVDRRFVVDAPNRTWVADCTYVAAWAGRVYVAFVVDIFSRRIVGWFAVATRQTELVLSAVEMSLWQRDHEGWRHQPGGLIHHSEAGRPYLSRTTPGHGQDLESPPDPERFNGRVAVWVASSVVICHMCGTTWVGGSTVPAAHPDLRKG
ncbi:DDE-type integrase/transposase/recombinase [Streptomyces sp. NBC_00669]|uniref:DDE-type integrase/transposase/recombinase n=1 Tax=Streptomyces sp. NBC_00669 TaxID=2976011 RepID=UPI003FA734B9